MTPTNETFVTYPCVKCPTSCEVTVRVVDGQIAEVTGNGCRLGEAYVRKEHISPERNVTTTVKLIGAIIVRLPVRTSKEVAKAAIYDVMKAAATVVVTAPVLEGQVVLAKVAGTEADLVACRSLPAVAPQDVPRGVVASY